MNQRTTDDLPLLLLVSPPAHSTDAKTIDDISITEYNNAICQYWRKSIAHLHWSTEGHNAQERSFRVEILKIVDQLIFSP